MTLLAIVLVVISAFLHAGWNLLSKSQRPSTAFFLVASLAGTLVLSPSLVVFYDTIVNGIPARVWALLLATGFFLALYYAGLAGAYRNGDMSVAYPLARSSPVIVVAIVTLMLGRGDQVSALCLAGIALVVGGCFLVPLQRLSGLRLANYLNATCGLALLAAVGTTGYSIIDDEALRQLRTSPRITIGHTQVTLLYACLEWLAASLWLAIFVAARRESRTTLRRIISTTIRPAVHAGVAICLAYTLVLISLAFVNNVSYVVGFRQISIPLGAVAGVIVLKEAPHPPKVAGVVIMFVGLVMLALG